TQINKYDAIFLLENPDSALRKMTKTSTERHIDITYDALGLKRPDIVYISSPYFRMGPQIRFFAIRD
ncbi:MAG: hypothetical protein ABF917_12450, partial [Gluconobacter oxydans]|uniref:hypothetical protein n=1 Tax=Gluconobacter oxydans TaxID=442 RepID=UPI0039ED0918